MKFIQKILLILLLIFYSFSCSYRPIFDQNEKYLNAGEKKAQNDFEICKKSAEKYLNQYKAERAAKEAGRKAAIGGIIGATTSLIFGKGIKSTLVGTLIGVGAGASIGAIGVIGEDKIKPDEMKQRYVSSCLAQKGYSIMGWK
jgi:ABC-type dipeptide/oligopeptide/nickel transport system permease subunit